MIDSTPDKASGSRLESRVDRWLEALWNYVGGTRNPTMHERLYGVTCLLICWGCLFLVLPANLFLGLPMFVNVADVILGVYAFHLHKQYQKGHHHPVLLFVGLILLLDLAWFPNAGSDGSVTFYFFTAVMLPVVLCRGATRWALVGFLNLSISDDIRRAQEELNQWAPGSFVVADHETVLEASYKVQATAWWTLQPSFQ